MSDIKLGVGEIPLDKLCNWLNMRSYNKEMMLDYIKKIYEVNVSNDIEDVHKQGKIIFDFRTNMYEKFETENPTKKEDTGSRYWFNNYGRKRYVEFLMNCMLFSCDFEKIYDEIIDMEADTDIHHIFPLQHGGKSNLINLISVCPFFHEILSNNPLIHIEKYGFQAVDYLRYLVRERWSYMNEQYNLSEFLKKDKKLFSDIFTMAIKREMNKFYDLIIVEFEKEEQKVKVI